MDILGKIERGIFLSRPSLFALTAIFVALLKSGIWCSPSMVHSLAIAQNPFTNPLGDPALHFVMYSWLGSLIAWCVGAKTFTQFFLLHLLFSAAAVFLFVRFAFSNLSDEAARKSIVIFLALPVSMTSFYWVGIDSLTLLLLMITLTWLPDVSVVFIAAGILLGLQHFEQAMAATFGLMAAIVLSGEKRQFIPRLNAKNCALLIAGIVAGRLVLAWIFNFNSVSVNSGRAYWLSENLGSLLRMFALKPYNVIWSFFGLGWIVAVWYAARSKTHRAFFAALFLLCLLLPISGDQTRVLAIVTFPLIFACWLSSDCFLKTITKPEISFLAVAWIVVPWQWIWAGSPRSSALPYDVAFLLNKLFGVFNFTGSIDRLPF